MHSLVILADKHYLVYQLISKQVCLNLAYPFRKDVQHLNHGGRDIHFDKCGGHIDPFGNDVVDLYRLHGITCLCMGFVATLIQVLGSGFAAVFFATFFSMDWVACLATSSRRMVCFG